MKKNTLLIISLFSFFFYDGHAVDDLAPIDVTAEETPTEITGFQAPLEELPFSVSSYAQRNLRAAQVQRLADLTRLDAAITDSYNATGYWDIISIRGFTLDNRNNFQREGLPINAETSIPLENKERVEVLKGLAGIQAGTSSPGGLVNYVVKRPIEEKVLSLRLEISEENNVLKALDVGGRFQEKFGYRFNLAHEQINPLVRNTEGERNLLAAALDWRISNDSILEFEFEWSRRSQPSAAGFSLLGNTLPSPVNPNLNLNNQEWSRPVNFEALTGTLRFTQIVNSDWSWTLTAGGQNLMTDDRLAYPFGCSAENNYDRYCSDGTYDLYDYRSEDERRETRALKLLTQGEVTQGSFTHHLNLGGWVYTAKDRMNPQAYNFVGTGNIQGEIQVNPDPTPNDPGTDRDSKNIEIFIFDHLKMNSWNAWLGLRRVYLKRESERTDGSRPISYSQNFTLPWAALSYNFSHIMTYISYGQGLESFVTPNRSTYNNPGKFLPNVISRQWEAGAKGSGILDWSLALFQLSRPLLTDQAPVYKTDGHARQRGVEVELSKKIDQWLLQLSAMKLEVVRKESSLLSEFNNNLVVNTPKHTIRASLGYELPSVKGLSLDLRIIHEGERAVTLDNEQMLPSWTRLDAGLSYIKNKMLARLYIENLADKRYWRESPTQYGHIYLYPGADRRVGLNLQYGF